MLNFIYNPIAGKGKAQRFRVSIEERLKALGVAYSFWETTRTKGAGQIARELSLRGERDIVAMGGDGTVHEILNGLTDPSKIHLGIIACGTGNDFAAVIGIPETPEGGLDVLLNETPKDTDYLECSGIRGLNIIGAGIDVDILKRYYRSKLPLGKVNYYIALIAALIHFQFSHFVMHLNGQRSRHEGLIVCACNGRRLGGGICICPKAEVDDGQLDVVLVEDVKKAMIPKALVQLAMGKILEQKYTTHRLTDRLAVEFDEPTTVQIDGELYDNLPFDVRIVKNGLKIYRK